MEQLLVGSAGSDSSSGIEVLMDSHSSLHERTGENIMPIAIVGMSCRFPGDATSPEKLWNLCAEARSAWSEVPLERFNQKAFYHPQAEKLGTVSHLLKIHRHLHILTIFQSNVAGAHFLTEDVALFDASFFNFTSEVATVGPTHQSSERCILIVPDHGSAIPPSAGDSLRGLRKRHVSSTSSLRTC